MLKNTASVLRRCWHGERTGARHVKHAHKNAAKAVGAERKSSTCTQFVPREKKKRKFDAYMPSGNVSQKVATRQHKRRTQLTQKALTEFKPLLRICTLYSPMSTAIYSNQGLKIVGSSNRPPISSLPFPAPIPFLPLPPSLLLPSPALLPFSLFS